MKKGWQVKKIGDTCRLMTGGTPSKAKPEYFGGETRWLVSGDIHKGEIFECEGRITAAGMRNSNAKFLPINSVMIALNGQGKTRGTVALLRTQATCNQSLVSIYPNDPENLLPEFLFINLHRRYQELRQMTGDSGNDRRGLNMGIIANIEIPIPPLPTQQRIVSILNGVFGVIAKAQENAEKNLQNAKELFESYLQNVFSNPREEWEEKKLGEVCEIIMGQSPDGQTYNTEGKGVPLINGPVEFSPEPFSKTIKSKYTTQPTKYCKAGDLMLCVRGSTTGRTNISGFDACIGRGVAAIRYVKHQSWVNYFILSSRNKIYQLGTGSTFPNVSSNLISNLTIPIPDISDQQSVIAKLDALSVEAKKLEAIYQKKLADLEELKKSILQKAFKGELT